MSSAGRSAGTAQSRGESTSRAKSHAETMAAAAAAKMRAKRPGQNGKPARYVRSRSGGGGSGGGEGRDGDVAPKEKMSKWRRTAQIVATTGASMVLGSSLGRLQHAIEKKYFKPGYFDTIHGAILGIVFGIVMSLLVLWIFE